MSVSAKAAAGAARRDLALVYVPTPQDARSGGHVYDLAAGEMPTSAQERVRLRLVLIDALRAVAAADEADLTARSQQGRRVPPPTPAAHTS